MGCCGLNPENTDDVEERKRQNKQNKEIEKQVSEHANKWVSINHEMRVHAT